MIAWNEVAPQAVMGFFGGKQIETNKEEFSAECHSVDWSLLLGRGSGVEGN